MAVLYTPHFIQFFGEDGITPLSGGKLWTYAAGTTAPKASYTTAAGDVENTNPVILDSDGRAVVFISGSYKFLLTDADDVPVGPNGGVTDNVTSFTALDSTNDPFFESFSGNGTQTVFTASEDLGTDERAIYVWVDNGIREYSTNGTFTTDTDWTKGTGWTIAAGVATATGAISTAISQTAAFTAIEGRAYSVTFTITRSAGTLTASIGGTSGTAYDASGTYTDIIVAGSTQTIAFTGAGFTGTLDAVSVKPVSGEGYQILPPTAYTINGTSLTLNAAPASGSGNILVSAPLLLVGAASSSAAAAAAAEAGALAAQAAAEAAAEKLTGTSTTSLLIEVASKVFTTQTGKYFDAGSFLLITSDADPTNYMFGQVTTYSGTSLTVNVTVNGGSGTFADWTIRVAGTRGATGATGDIGDIDALDTATPDAAADYFIFSDANDSGNTKRALITAINSINTQTVASSATVTPTSANDLVIVTAQAEALAIANPSGTMTQGQALIMRIKDNGTARAISFGTNYRALGTTLPTTTVLSKTLYLAMVWNDTDTKFDVTGVAQEA